MRKERSALILGLLGMLLVHSPAEAQSFGPAAWIRQSWAEEKLFSIDIAVGPGKEVFVTGQLGYRQDAYFEASSLDSSDIRFLDTPDGGSGFLVRYNGENGELRFVRPGSILPGVAPPLASDYSVGHSVAVVDGRLFHGEGRGVTRYNTTGSAMVTVRDLEGSVLHRIGPREIYPRWSSIFIQGTEFDVQGNLYLAGTYTDTLFFSPDVVLAPSMRHVHHTFDVFIASYAPDGTVRWARQVEAGTGPLWISTGPYGMTAFDMDAEGNMVLGAVASGVPPAAFSAAEDGAVLATYDREGTMQRIRTLEDMGIAYRPSFSELLHDLGPITRGFANAYVPRPTSIRHDKGGNMYALWRKTVESAGTNSMTVGDTTFYDQGEEHIYVLTKFDAQGSLLWARRLEHDFRLVTRGMEITEEGHVYVWGYFWGHYLAFEGTKLTQDEPQEYDGFAAHYDENGNFVRALHLQSAGSGYQYIDALGIGPSGDVYIAGRYTDDMAVIGADTLHARGENNVFVAKYSATSLSSEPSLEIPSTEIEAANYPNPFHGATTITYSVPVSGRVRLTVYDMLGREVALLMDERQSAGSYSARLDASAWPGGVYMYRLEASDQVASGMLVHRK